MKSLNAQPLRVLVSGHLPPISGGIATYCQSLLNSPLPKMVNLQFVQTSSQTRDFTQSGRGSLSNIIYAIKDIWRFTRAVINHRPQVTHITTAFGLSFIKHSVCLVVARIAGSKILLHPHCSISVLYFDRPVWWQFLFRQVLHLTDGIIALSEEWKQIRYIAPNCPVYFIPNAVDRKQYLPVAQDRFCAPRQKDNLFVLYLGHLGRDKGSFDLIDSAEIVSKKQANVLFEMIGSELMTGELGKLSAYVSSKNMGDYVKLLPAAYGEEKLFAFDSADVFVYPSYHEGMPMAVLEAMACGLPIVASNVGALQELVCDGKNGFLVSPGRPAQLAEGILKIIEKPELRSSMGLQSYQIIAEQYDLEMHIQKLVEAYQRSCSQK